MTDISARQTFTTAENSRFSDYPGSADTPESGSCIEAHGLTRSTELLADRRNRVTMGRRKARPTRARKLPPSNESHSRNSATAGLSPRRTRRLFGPSFAPSLVPHPALLCAPPTACAHSQTTPTPLRSPLTDHLAPSPLQPVGRPVAPPARQIQFRPAHDGICDDVRDDVEVFAPNSFNFDPHAPVELLASGTMSNPWGCSIFIRISTSRHVAKNALNGPTTSFTDESAHVSEGRPRGPCGPKWKSTFFGAKNPPVAPLTSATYSGAGACHRSPFPASTPGPPRALPRCAGDARRCAAKASRNRGTDRAPSLR